MPLAELDLPSHGRLLSRLLPGALGLAICDATGRGLWAAESQEQFCARVLATLNERCGGWAGSDKPVQRFTLPEERAVHVLALRDGAGENLGALLAITGGDGGQQRAVLDALVSTAHCMRSEIAHLQELDSMAAELGRRYEELNLIYVTEDNVKYFDEGQDALRKLVQNTASYLDLGLAALVMADDSKLAAAGEGSARLPGVEALLQQASSELLELVRFRKAVLVINDVAGADVPAALRELPLRLLCAPVYDENGAVLGMLMVARHVERDAFCAGDVKLLRVMARKAARIIQVNYDALTGMMTRHGFEYHLETALYIVRYKRAEHCVLHLNLDRMHLINDTCGHHAGDELIRRTADVIRRQLREGDIVARLGGDHFGVLLSGCSVGEGQELAEEIRKAIGKMSFRWDRQHFEVTTSIGLATMTAETDNIVAVISGAEMACAAAKDRGRNRVQTYAPDDTILMQRRAEFEWIGQLHNALREDRFVLYSQKILPLQTAMDEHVAHTEILLRLRGDGGQILGPDAFLPSAERYNLMPAIDRWVVRNVVKMLAANLPERARSSTVWAINLSGQSIGDGEFLEFVVREVQQAGVPPRSICFEITETAAVANLKKAQRFIEALKERGFRFALDDFGSGLSSFAYLKTLPVDYLKIDGSFVREIAEDRVSESMVAAINQIGLVMGLETIAEFVENDGVRETLERLGVNFGQGFGIERPKPLLELLTDLTPSLKVAGL